MKSELLPELYSKYDIPNLRFGIKTDKLGDVYEDFVVEIFRDLPTTISLLKTQSLEKEIIKEFFRKTRINIQEVTSIKATTKCIPRRKSGGSSKTDVIVYLELKNRKKIDVPISVKQTSAPKVAFAEFSVDTICEEVGITDPIVKKLMEKHQRDASATNFTSQEKKELKLRLEPYVERLLRWIITMSPTKNTPSNAYPKWVLKFNLTKETSEVIDWHFYSIEEYIDYIRLNKKGNPKSGGFGTGLSWTYATGSKGTKIQFKG